jgi:hypothetical protein
MGSPPLYTDLFPYIIPQIVLFSIHNLPVTGQQYVQNMKNAINCDFGQPQPLLLRYNSGDWKKPAALTAGKEGFL